MKILLAIVASVGLSGVCHADWGGSDDAARVMFYFEQPLGGTKGEPFTLGLRLDAGRSAERVTLPVFDFRVRERGGMRFHLGGVPVFGYMPEEAYSEIPWWAWAIGGAAAACAAHAGICKDDSPNNSPPPSSAPTCPTCAS
jgi:hypothetical protein